MNDEHPQPQVTVSVYTIREDGSTSDYTESFDGVDYLTEDQFRRFVDKVGGVILTGIPDDEATADVDTSRMFGGDA